MNDDSDELGIIASGPLHDELAGQVSDLLHRWSRTRPARPTVTACPAELPGAQLEEVARVARPTTQLTISW
ncbi:hypothetical protein ACFV4P_22685 [Kitasatospora sp. NPDC059795]|uniref:hypothetical protein n=1 Tax=Kitasatospora sp. NPDC059795 TaxID=3346949 RepID=UPI00364DC2D1